MDGERKRRYYSISEVSDMMDLKPHILRYWETEFPLLRPRKNRAGNRAYTERDIKIVRVIRTLLYDEKYTIEGARQRLKENRDHVDEQLQLPLEQVEEHESSTSRMPDIEDLKKIRNEIAGIIGMVERL